MQKVSPAQFGNPNRDGLQAVLEHCQKMAFDRSHPIVASITLASEYLDPLAVLQSVNDPAYEHCYWERNSRHEAVACAEPVLKFEVSGVDRFLKAKAYIQEWLDHTVFVGDPELPWAGPHFFTSVAFEDDKGNQTDFIEPSLQLILPRWQVGWRGAQFSATANVVVNVDTPISHLVEPIWRAHQRFTSFEFDPNAETSDLMNIPHASSCQIVNREESESAYLNAVKEAIGCIQKGEFLKVVVSRSIEIQTESQFHPLDLLNKLRKKYPDCCSFSWQNGNGASFIGATPERLVRVWKGVFETEALAGSIERGESARLDAWFSKQLLSSEKDRMEHGLVLQFIQETLASLGVEIETSTSPEVLQLSNIQHLRVPIKGKLNADMHVLDFVDALHPTPALGGYPQTESLKKLSSLEGKRRDRYGGLTGWVDADGNGEFSVNIRCAKVTGNQAVLYAGAGIVEDSDPDKELRETELKLIGMLPNFMNTD